MSCICNHGCACTNSLFEGCCGNTSGREAAITRGICSCADNGVEAVFTACERRRINCCCCCQTGG